MMSEAFTHTAAAAAEPVMVPATPRPPRLEAAEARALARELVVTFRRHPHINNVLTHVALGRWERVEDALTVILAAPADAATLSPLARNLLDLLWGEAGVTGRILKPLFLDRCRRALPPARGEACVHGVAALYARAAVPVRQAAARQA
jgi:hypothetical protein